MNITHRTTAWRTRAAAATLSLALLAGAAACTSSNSSSAPVMATSAAGVSGAAAASLAGSAAAPQVTVPAQSTSSADAGAASTSAPTTLSPTDLSPTTSTSLPPAEPAAHVVASPALGTSDLDPAAPISIAVKNGTIKSLQVLNPAGKVVTGKLSSNDSEWMLGEDLGYGKTYTVAGTAVGLNGQIVKIAGTYSTVSPGDQATAHISPGDGEVVGVAAPIIVRFSSDPTSQKAAIEKRMKVVTSPAVAGSWAWITHDGDTYPSLDWRPENYWPQYTKVHVEADIYGTAFSDQVYGAADETSDFTIGRNQVVIADAKKFDIVVQQSGKTVATYPGSFGGGDDPNSRFGLSAAQVTRSGIHIVMDKQQTVSMSNPGFYTNSIEHWAVRISDNGEFIHENPNTVSDQGNTNVSHGCINLSPQDAEAYYNSAIYGDPVDVINTSVQLSPADGDIYDWTYSWSTWQSLSAL